MIRAILIVLLVCLSARHTALASTKKARSNCLKAGGEWGVWTRYDGTTNHHTCRFKAKDAGKPCSDGKECSIGRCEFNPTTKSGACYAYDSSEGCHAWMTAGKADRTLCVD